MHAPMVIPWRSMVCYHYYYQNLLLLFLLFHGILWYVLTLLSASEATHTRKFSPCLCVLYPLDSLYDQSRKRKIVRSYPTASEAISIHNPRTTLFITQTTPHYTTPHHTTPHHNTTHHNTPHHTTTQHTTPRHTTPHHPTPQHRPTPLLR